MEAAKTEEELVSATPEVMATPGPDDDTEECGVLSDVTLAVQDILDGRLEVCQAKVKAGNAALLLP
eukprot:1696366-Amphidinium_carterae.2